MPGKQMLCCILISIISEGDMKIFISLFLFIISTNSFADDITHAGVVRIEGLITEKTCIISNASYLVYSHILLTLLFIQFSNNI